MFANNRIIFMGPHKELLIMSPDCAGNVGER